VAWDFQGAQKAKELCDEEGNVTKFGAKLDLQKRHLQLGTCQYARQTNELRLRRQADLAAHLTTLWQSHLRYIYRHGDLLTRP